MLIDDTTDTPDAVKPKKPADVNATIQPKPVQPILIAGPGGAGGAVPAGATKPERGAVPAAPSATPGAPSAPSAGGVQMAGPSATITSTAGDSFGGSALPAPTAGAVPVGGTTTAVPASGPAAPQGVGNGVGLTPTNPANPLTGQTIAPANTVDRFALAQQRFDTFAKSTDPAYQSALRQANRMGAAGGQLGSGELRTDFGNLANARGLALDTSRDSLFQDALGGTIDDAYRNVGIAQQQQGFQQGQQQQAFENELRRLGFSEDMLNSAFGRSLQQWMAGQTGGTGSGTVLAGANATGNAGSDALAALEAFARQRAASGAATSTLPTTTPTSQPDDALSRLFQYGGRA
jgi:hypothetical protein